MKIVATYIISITTASERTTRLPLYMKATARIDTVITAVPTFELRRLRDQAALETSSKTAQCRDDFPLLALIAESRSCSTPSAPSHLPLGFQRRLRALPVRPVWEQ